jgi:nucleotide-binding universal stress UspA family protein
MFYKHILVPVDGSDISFSAVKHASEIARAFQSQLSLISIVTENPFQEADFYTGSAIMKEYFVIAEKNANEALVKAKTIASDAGITAQTSVIKGDLSEQTVIETSQNLNADLIVMGSHGRKGFQKFLLGSFANDVLKNTTLPVLIIKS